MDTQKINSFILANTNKFATSDLANIKTKLENIDDKKLSLIEGIKFKNPTTILILSFFSGGFGIDRFMLGDTTMAIIKLLTCGGCGIWAILDLFSAKNRTYKYNMAKLNQVIASL